MLNGRQIKQACALGCLLVALATPVAASPLAANTGTIESLTATDGPDPGDVIQIASRVRTIDKVNKSNLYYEILAPDGVTVVATHQTSPPKMGAGDTFSDSWSTSNASFPSSGTYTVTLCWSTGNAHNCDIDYAETTFYSVPTLGLWLSMAGAALIGWWIRSQRRELGGAG